MADDFMAPIVGRNSIATSNGKTWKMLHNAMAPALAQSHIKNLITVITEEVLVFRERLDKLASTGEVFSMEKLGAELIFDVIARIVFHFPLHAQTQGSQYLDDLREMIHLVDAQFSFNPFVKIKALLKRGAILRRLHASILNQIMDRQRLLMDKGIVPRKKDPYSILDLMLREHVQEQGSDLKGKKATQLTSEYLELLITKCVQLCILYLELSFANTG
jgi:cytochrome P450